MKRKLLLLTLLASPIFVQAASTPAQTTPPTVTEDAAKAAGKTDAPPPPQVSDDQSAGPEPEVTIVQRGKDKIEEYRLNGKLYMVKVTPSIGVPYYLMDEDGNGAWRQVDPNRRIVIPHWVLFRF
ncbi:MAG: DUF2782 domain-containing protein [Paludibacterium sp.]|uniref:DUF2782 domain-containing protein n=1 Tax=Paludibacterium sp. TaxID=1917523 RepID=UPI0025EE9FD4|nr:DUF2782 domain-containing protein [Paludibacterium sp.]MBV8048595.1 DUF2782 domain-containing protein [Paludibacterium sp.]MBV8647945.1 DUF2782 domain-containing protein [Paludibacterium sp.]